MNKPKIILLGGGGHCKSCIDVIEQEDKFEVAGILDMPEKIGEEVLGYKFIGTDDDLPDLVKKYDNFLITVGQLGLPTIRMKIYERILKLGGNFPVIISPHSYVSKHSLIGEGSIVMHGAIVNVGAKIGYNCIINSQTLIEHDAVIGNHCHISTGIRINGMSEVGEKSFVGSGSTLNQNIIIVPETLISSGSLVRKSILISGLYAGNPLKKLK